VTDVVEGVVGEPAQLIAAKRRVAIQSVCHGRRTGAFYQEKRPMVATHIKS
jgi:hypothetical protein